MTRDIEGTVAFTRSRGRNGAALADLVRLLPGALSDVVLDPATAAMVIGAGDDTAGAAALAASVGGVSVTVAQGDHVSLFLTGAFLDVALAIAAEKFGLARRNTGRTGQTLLVLSGPPRVGKTAVARAIADGRQATRVSSDAVRRELFPDRDCSPAERTEVYRQCLTRVVDAVSETRLTIFDATNLRRDPTIPDKARQADHAAWIQGADSVVLHLRAPDGELLKRLGQRSAGPVSRTTTAKPPPRPCRRSATRPAQVMPPTSTRHCSPRR